MMMRACVIHPQAVCLERYKLSKRGSALAKLARNEKTGAVQMFSSTSVSAHSFCLFAFCLFKEELNAKVVSRFSWHET